MARRLDKIEKDIGYCEIKLEKERRLRKQIQFVRDDLEILEQLILSCQTRGMILLDQGGGMGGESHQKATRDSFFAAGLMEIMNEEKDILIRERDELISRLKSFSGFGTRRGALEEEKKNALNRLSPVHSSKLRKVSEDFKKIERLWNAFTEDLVNLDEGIFFLDRNLDYLKSCRSFLISTKGSFDFGFWNSQSKLSNLFRHSSIGRAKEMADGADRNLKMSQKELVCVSSVKLRPELFQRVLLRILESLFEDIFVQEKLESSIRLLESVLAENLKLTEQVKEKRYQLSEKLEKIEKDRNEMFVRLGSGKRNRVTV